MKFRKLDIILTFAVALYAFSYLMPAIEFSNREWSENPIWYLGFQTSRILLSDFIKSLNDGSVLFYALKVGFVCLPNFIVIATLLFRRYFSFILKGALTMIVFTGSVGWMFFIKTPTFPFKNQNCVLDTISGLSQ